MSTPRTIKLLHVEDNVADRLLVARLLGTSKEFSFNIVRAATEITAVTELTRGGIEFVILDYRLPLGDGLGCLRKLRHLDPAVPIIVISGVTTPEIGAECVQAGADDYMSKQDLTSEKLIQSVRRCMNRATTQPVLRSTLFPFCRAFVSVTGSELLKGLDELEASARGAEMTIDRLQRLFESVANELDREKAPEDPSARLLLRPLLLELRYRLFENKPVEQKK